uniref:RNase H type-1 domain-containing protein n=1 Tax=Leptobrachium leishanense TaxID=445787 RepID=A0A8C5LVU1_9ANUR
MTKYQAMLCEDPRVHLELISALNPATLLPDAPKDQEHECLHVMDEVYSSRPDLKDIPLDKYDMQLFTDGSSFVENGKRFAGYAVVTLDETIEAKPLPNGTSAQLAEIIELSENKRVNIYTDSKYAFMTIHAHGALYKDRGLLTSAGKQVKYALEILNLLDAVWKPSTVGVIHCRGHQKGKEEVPRGNRKADLAAKEAARQTQALERGCDWKETKAKSTRQQQVQQQEKTHLKLNWRGYPVQDEDPLESVRGGYPVNAENHLKSFRNGNPEHRNETSVPQRGLVQDDSPVKILVCEPESPQMKVETLLCLNSVFQDQPNVDFYMNKRKFAPQGEFIEDVLRHWYGEYEFLEKHHSYIQWLFPLCEQSRNEHAKPLTISEIEIMKNTAEIQHRLRRAYKLMLNFFGVKLVGEEEIEVIRDSNFSTRFSNLNTNTHNNLRITRIVKSMGELGAAQYQALLVKFFLKEILVDDQLQNMKKSALKYFLPAVKNDHEEMHCLNMF